MIETYLKTGKQIERIHIGESINYEKNSLFLFDCPRCNHLNELELVSKKHSPKIKEGIIQLKYPNVNNDSLEFIRSISKLFNLKEVVYEKTGIHTFKVNTSFGLHSCFVEFYECGMCKSEYIICMSFFGDYSRYPGARIQLIGIEKLNTSI